MRRLTVFLCLLLIGCGYQLSLGPPDLLREISLEEVKTKDSPKFASALYRSLREEFESKGIKVTENAKRKLIAELMGLKFETIAFDRSAYATQYRASVSMDFKLLEDEKVIWSLSGLRKEKVFSVKGPPSLDEQVADKALEEIAHDIAHELYLRFVVAGLRCPCSQ